MAPEAGGGELDPKVWAQQFAEKFRFGRVEQDAEGEERAEGAEEVDEIQSGVRLRLETNLEHDIGRMISILEGAGFKPKDISEALKDSLDVHAQGTDFDVEYGNGFAGIARLMRATILQGVFTEKFGQPLASLVAGFLRRGKYDTAGYQDLAALGMVYSFLNEEGVSSDDFSYALSAFGRCNVAPRLDNRENLMLFVRLSKITDDDQFSTIVNYVNDMTADSDELNMDALEEALGVVEKDGVAGLLRHKRALGWEE